MKITCFIEYQIDPFKKDAFEQYARNWGEIIPRCGGQLIGYFLPHEGSNIIAYGLIAFNSLADYEQYRSILKEDEKGKANFEFAQKGQFILKETRAFLMTVPDTFLKYTNIDRMEE